MAEETSNLAVVVKAAQTSRLKSFCAVLLWLSSIHLVIFLSFLMLFVLSFRWSLTWAFWCLDFFSSRLILICCNLVFAYWSDCLWQCSHLWSFLYMKQVLLQYKCQSMVLNFFFYLNREFVVTEGLCNMLFLSTCDRMGFKLHLHLYCFGWLL